MKSILSKIIAVSAVTLIIGGTVYGQCVREYKNNCVNNSVCQYENCINDCICQYNNDGVRHHKNCTNTNVTSQKGAGYQQGRHHNR